MPGDRGGGRESKGSSLKLKNPGVEKKNKKVAKADTGLPTATAPPPPLGEGANLDCGVALISRQFDRDRDRVIQRSRDEGDVCAMLLWSSDWEKQEAVAKLCAERRGQVGPGQLAAQRIARRRAGCNGNRPAGWKFSCADHARATPAAGCLAHRAAHGALCVAYCLVYGACGASPVARRLLYCRVRRAFAPCCFRLLARGRSWVRHTMA